MRTRVLFIFVFFLLLIVKKTEGQGTLITKSSITPNTCSLVDSTIKLVSSNLPIIIIDTKGQAIPLKDRVVVDMKIIYNGEGVRNNIKDEYNDYDGKIAIERRGWSSRKYPKKQYAFETQDEKGENLNVSLMGLPAENDWVLNAPYGDKSLMRNVLTYQLARNMGWYASRTKFCELIFDNEYRGVYVLIEKIKRDKNRVDISKLKPDEISGDDLTGGYIIKIDKFDEGEDSLWISAYPSKYDEDNRIHYLYRYPEGDDIVYEQKKYIQNYVYEFETIMDGPYYTDPITGYYTHINVNSFVDFFIINEIGRNIDGYRLSTYMFKDKDSKGGKLTMGPVWDFNLAFGNANYYDGVEIDGWDVEKMSGYGHGKYNIPFWWKKFMADARFMNRVFNRWHELREDILSVDVLFSFIDSVAISLDESQTRNFIAWDILGNYVWPNAPGYDDRITYQDEIDYLKQWLHERIEWMDNNIPADAAAVTWVDPDSVNLSGFVGVEKVISISEIVKDSVNIDSIIFESDNPNLKIIQDIDSIRITAITSNVFEFFSIAWSSGDTVSVSPDYTFTSSIVDIAENPEMKPVKFSLNQNYPNPFNLLTTIKYELPQNSYVTLKIYNMFGQEVRTLVNSYQTAGFKSITWDGKNNLDLMVSSGIYIYSLQADTKIQLGKMLLLK